MDVVDVVAPVVVVPLEVALTVLVVAIVIPNALTLLPATPHHPPPTVTPLLPLIPGQNPLQALVPTPGPPPQKPKQEIPIPRDGVATPTPLGVQPQPLTAPHPLLLLLNHSLFLPLDPLSRLPPPRSSRGRKSLGVYLSLPLPVFVPHPLLRSAPEKPSTPAASAIPQPAPNPPVPPAPLDPPREPTPPTPAQETELATEAQTGWEEPTTVQNPPWEDELQSKSSAPVVEPWDTAPAEEAQVHDETKPDLPEPSPAPPPEPVPEPISVSLPAPQPKEPVSGLSEAIPKHVSPVQARPSSAAHKHSSRFKTDQAVTLPNNFGSGLEKVGMQFGSLSIGGDEIIDPKP